jgi:hypothetical protein
LKEKRMRAKRGREERVEKRKGEEKMKYEKSNKIEER